MDLDNGELEIHAQATVLADGHLLHMHTIFTFCVWATEH